MDAGKRRGAYHWLLPRFTRVCINRLFYGLWTFVRATSLAWWSVHMSAVSLLNLATFGCEMKVPRGSDGRG